MDRRSFLSLAAMAAVAATVRAASPGRAPRILLRSSWQTVNIGDIAHTPGVLALLEQHLPEAEVTLWPSSVDNGVGDILRRRFPKLRILPPGKVDVAQVYADHDFLLHGSGPSLVAEKDVVRWRQAGPKPYGVLGITLTKPAAATVDVLSGARFAFFRDGVSHALAVSAGVKCTVMGFFPDGAFATDLRDDAKAEAFLKANGLEAGGFLCCIPRYRQTPYWLVKPNVAFDEAKQKRNDALKEHDHAQLRAAIVQVVRLTKLKVLVCPEDRTQMALGKEILFDPLPDDVKARVVWRPDYWLTDEAISVYVRSAGLFGNEMHSPIMAVGHGVPAIVCRWAEQTSKGTMWKDIGLSEWLFDLDDEPQLAGIVPAVLALAKDPAAAREKVKRAQAVVQARQIEAFAALKRSL
jgi:polysaccharide pyruvyl transferase WcaK-like protein